MRKKIRNIFITGSTGFLASNLLRVLLERKENHVYALIRAKDNKSLLRRKNLLINILFPGRSHLKKTSRIHVLKGDISKANAGLSTKDLDELKNIIDTVYHSAAICGLSHDLEDIRRVNVRGTENILRLALDWHKNGHLEDVNHISTAYIAGDHKGTFYEHQIDVSQGFNNSYEQSKFEAELIVQKYRKMGLPVDIHRPSIITDTAPPGANVVSKLFRLLGALASGIFKKIPADEHARLNMIPVDAVAKAIYLISTTKSRPGNQNYHIVNPRSVTFGTLLNTAAARMGFRKPACVPLPQFRMDKLSRIQQTILGSFAPYLNQRLSFDVRNADSVLKKYRYEVPSITREMMVRVFSYYRSSGAVL